MKKQLIAGNVIRKYKLWPFPYKKIQRNSIFIIFIIRMPTHKIISPTLRYKDEMFSPLRKLKLQKRKKKKHRGRCSGALRQFFISVLSLYFTIVLIKTSIRFPVLSFFLSLYLNDFILRTVP